MIPGGVGRGGGLMTGGTCDRVRLLAKNNSRETPPSSSSSSSCYLSRELTSPKVLFSEALQNNNSSLFKFKLRDYKYCKKLKKLQDLKCTVFN